jgi:hypothetical protein
LNEFNIFGKRPGEKPKEIKQQEFLEQDDDLIYRILEKLKKGINLKLLKFDLKYHYSSLKSADDKDILFYTYIINRNKTNPIDPYGEENWEDESPKNLKELIIMIQKERKDEDKNKRIITINNVQQIVSDKAFDKLWEFFQNGEKIEKERLAKEEERIRQERLAEEERIRREKSAAMKTSFMDFLKENYRK